MFQTSRTLIECVGGMPRPSAESGTVTFAGPPGVQLGGTHGGGTGAGGFGLDPSSTHKPLPWVTLYAGTPCWLTEEAGCRVNCWAASWESQAPPMFTLLPVACRHEPSITEANMVVAAPKVAVVTSVVLTVHAPLQAHGLPQPDFGKPLQP